jgi:hypothetical protein
VTFALLSDNVTATFAVAFAASVTVQLDVPAAPKTFGVQLSELTAGATILICAEAG